jgi:hypothetical protein
MNAADRRSRDSGDLPDDAVRVGEYYDREIYEIELQRLEVSFPVEREITKRSFEKWIPKGAAIAEIGVGGGHYSEWLVRRGCHIHPC